MTTERLRAYDGDNAVRVHGTKWYWAELRETQGGGVAVSVHAATGPDPCPPRYWLNGTDVDVGDRIAMFRYPVIKKNRIAFFPYTIHAIVSAMPEHEVPILLSNPYSVVREAAKARLAGTCSVPEVSVHARMEAGAPLNT